MTSKKMFSHVLCLTSNFTERFFMFSVSSCQEQCIQLFKTCNARIPLQCKIIQLFKIVAFLFQFGIYSGFLREPVQLFIWLSRIKPVFS